MADIAGKAHSGVHEGGIAVIDFGSQVTQLIARRIREMHVYCEILPPWTTKERIEALAPRGIVLSGGPASVYGKDAPKLPAFLKDSHWPMLGICYGMQLLSHDLGGKVARLAGSREYGPATLHHSGPSVILRGVPVNSQVWMSHGDSVDRIPSGFRTTGRTSTCKHAVMENPQARIFGLQFHPEVVHTAHGTRILKNFVFDACGCKPNWTMKTFAKEAVARIKAQADGGRILVALSGGVDSSVTAALVSRAVGKRLIGVFVDNGLLRKGEGVEVIKFLKKQVGVNVRMIDARARFLRRLKGVTDPEKKRKHIGAEFIRVFEDSVRHLPEIKWLAQGTLYPDVIESVSTKGPSAVIKSHHNVGGLPKDMKFKLVEPLRELFKDEVRALGLELGIPRHLLWRHPFPGPGLAVRVLGEVNEPSLKILREADAIFIEELRKSGWYDKVWQAFAVLLPVRTVGVMGDERTYANVIAIRSVDSKDGMTADWSKLPPELLAKVSSRIINEVRGVNRVAYDISSKPPSTIEWE